MVEQSIRGSFSGKGKGGINTLRSTVIGLMELVLLLVAIVVIILLLKLVL